ncbi:zinc metalloprotease [Haematobacter missouriensis]|uniref:M48 family peptidase n=1 Tax=Haematobacter missouriensis TaxID=366616 RepID=A0A212AL09_9RHOB|nr:SprT family zinc-dependent metalloprotease [Haematobacter missouriensis]KFI29512.1 zinc metalloprotease [Haematobacter missouriensis]OWJ80109.1 M48 family peptidase [Haematobacter missouriensis]OWJ82149.1 M48 family peptidase [Haematobacter missouriensis]
MTSLVLPGSPPIDISLRRSARARRFSLRVSRLDGRVTLSLPERARVSDALAFARDREEWIRDVLSVRPQEIRIAPDSLLPVEGRIRQVRLARVPRVVESGARELLVPEAAGARTAARVEAFLKRLAHERLEAACSRHARSLGRGYTKLTLRDTRSRWGSCTSDGRLMFSWRLILAPPEVLDYVAAHEVAHLVRMDHSPAFWAEVARLMPGYAAPRRWLRDHGQELHRYIFRGD